MGDLRAGHQAHRHDRMGAFRRRQACRAQRGEALSAQSRTGRDLSGRRDPLDRLSGPLALHPRHRHQSRQDQARALRPFDRRSAPDDAAAGDLMSDVRRVSAERLRAMLLDGGELALIDLREERIFSENHLLFARCVPLSRLELKMARLVPRRTTRIVLIDDADGLAERAAAVLAQAGYTDVRMLDGGNAAWEAAGYELFSGVNVPSKAFGELVEHENGTPSVSADELNALMQSGADMAVLDSRPFDEFSSVSIPPRANPPGAALVLRVHGMAPKPDTLVVVNCAGRTRSIIGAQSLINAGVPNKVVALRNGTMGWSLAGLAPDSGKSQRAPEVSHGALAWAKAAAERVAKRFGVMRIDLQALESFRADKTRTLYVFDV